MDLPSSFIRIINLLDEASKHYDGSKFWGYDEADTESLCVYLIV
jgi:hypothetical protein